MKGNAASMHKTCGAVILVMFMTVLGNAACVGAAAFSKKEQPTISSTTNVMKERSAGCIVRGRVTHSDGRPVSGVEVQAIDKGVRAEKVVGKTITQSDGRYLINYNQEGSKANLFVRIVDMNTKTEMGRSDTRFNAGQSIFIDVSLR